MTLGVLSPLLGGWYYGGILTGIARAASEAGHGVVAIQTLNAGVEQVDLSQPPDFRDPVSWQRVDGFVVVLQATDSGYLKAALAQGKPVVTIGHRFEDVACPVMVSDDQAGLRAAVEHLIEHGHRNIAFVGHLADDEIRQRYEAYRQVLQASGIEPDVRLLFDCHSRQQDGGAQAARAMLADGLPSTATIAGTDANAIGLIRTLIAEGRRVPADQAVVGFDDLPGAAYHVPSLASVRQPVDQIGEAAARELLALIQGKQLVARRQEVPTIFMARESCGCARSQLPLAPQLPRLPHELRWPVSSSTLAALLAAAFPEYTRSANRLAVLTDAADVIARAISGQSGLPSPRFTELDRALQRLVRLDGRPEILELIAGLLLPPKEDQLDPAVRKAVQAMIVLLMRGHTRALFADNANLQRVLGNQYEVSMQLLRGHEQDPRRLHWLGKTTARAGCLALWSGDGRAEPGADRPVDIVGTFRRDEPTGAKVPTVETVSDFPPADMLPTGEGQRDEMVFVVPLKDEAGYRGVLAVTDTVERGTASYTGRESINQWAALLTVALDRQELVETLRSRKQQLRIAAEYDHLTGLPNRALFLERLRQTIERSAQQPHEQYAVLFMDLDGFKVINDGLGHAVGDRLLVKVAKRITQCLRPTDIAARFGGDEFIILLDRFGKRSLPREVAERLQSAMATPFDVHGQKVVITSSIGIAMGRARHRSADDLLRDADMAMYWAKSHQRGSYAYFDIAMHTRALRRLRIETELRRSVERGEFEVHYQPIVDLPTGRIRAFEALIRWRRPGRHLAGPERFLDVAEETGLIIPISQWVLEEAAGRLADWQAKGAAGELYLSVNISDRQFWTVNLVEDIPQRLGQSGLDPSRLALEITEGVIMRDVTRARLTLEQLHALGCRLHIDDFGTGYSSLEAINHLPIDALKIDKSFVAELSTNTKSLELVRTIVMMGQNVGIDVIAEGVETQQQRDLLLDIGCPRGQGNLYSKPVPADSAENLITTAGSMRGPGEHLL